MIQDPVCSSRTHTKVNWDQTKLPTYNKYQSYKRDPNQKSVFSFYVVVRNLKSRESSSSYT